MIFLTHSFSRAKYALIFIDDFSLHSWVYFLKFKSEVFTTFNTFKAFVKNNSSHSIKNLCTYNVGEYASQAFKYFYREQGIRHQHYVPYTPQRNGIVEINNKKFKEMENCMIQYKDMAPSFLG
jgi:transposase InsO family protein